MLRLALLLMGLLLPVWGWADGMVLRPKAIAVETKIPDQRALLWWSNGTERLVIETRFTGEGTNFGWVVPLPSVPVVEATTLGVFPTLEHLTQPKVMHYVEWWGLLALAVAGLFWVAWAVQPGGRLRLGDWVAGVAVGGFWGMGGPIPLVLLGWGLVYVVVRGAAQVRAGKQGVWDYRGSVAAVFLFELVLASLAVPMAGKVDNIFGTKGSGVEVLSQQRVGVFDTVVLRSRDGADLTSWLTEHGFELPAGKRKAVDDYVREGWVFVASRAARPDPARSTSQLHPLVFTFASKEAVYPLRLTGPGNGTLGVELFVMGANRAAVTGFKVEDCRKVWMPASADDFWAGEEELPLKHPELERFGAGSACITRLTAELSEADMTRDATVTWIPFERLQSVKWSWRGTLICAGNFVALVASITGILRAWRVRRDEVNPGAIRPLLVRAAVIAGLGAIVIVAALPKTKVRMSARWKNWDWMRFQSVVELLPEKLSTPDAIRAALREAMAKQEGIWVQRGASPMTAREIDAPGNYTIVPQPGGVEVFWYLDSGEPRRLYPREK